MRRNLAHVLPLLLALYPVAFFAQETKQAPPPQTLEELQKRISSELEKSRTPGAGIALVSKGELLWCGGFGSADLASKRPITCDTEFRVGSISKSFVALALLKLQEDGKINLDAHLHDLAPEIPLNNPWESTNPVRVAN